MPSNERRSGCLVMMSSEITHTGTVFYLVFDCIHLKNARVTSDRFSRNL
jgi:hypothetical protein